MSAPQIRDGLLKTVITALLSAALTLGGAIVKDKVDRAKLEATVNTKLEGISKRVDQHDERLVWMSEHLPTREETREELQTIERRLDDIRALMSRGRE